MLRSAGLREPLVDLLVFALAALVAAVLVRDTRRIWRAFRLVQRGRYQEARETNERIAQSWLRLVPSVESAARYSIAVTHHMEGDFERALATLAAIDARSLDRNLAYAVASLEAAGLVLLERDLPRAAALLERAGAVHRPPEDLLVLAHAKHGLGDLTAAEDLLARAGASRGGTTVRLGRTLLATDRTHHDAIFHTMRGLLLVKLGDNEEALADFRASAAIPLQNWYTERARALVPPPAGERDPRSSLAPQVIGS